MFDGELKKLMQLYHNGLFTAEFYSSRIESPSVFESYDNFQRIPFTFKDDLRSTNIMDRTNTKIEDIYGVFSSSGTTGNKTYYIYNKNDKKIHEIFVKHFFEELGVDKYDLGCIIAPIDSSVIGHAMMWQFMEVGAGYINCTNINPEDIINIIRNVPVSIIATRPNIATLVAYNPCLSEKIIDSNVKKLLLGGGFLSDGRRKLLENVWGAECYNLLGMSEVFGPIAAECKSKSGLHYLNSYLMIEVINPKTMKPVDTGEIGVAVYTTLWEKGFPLLRYWSDDLVQISFEKCGCGSKLPRLFYHGRLSDSIAIGENKYIFPEMVENILFKYEFIWDYKVVIDDNNVTLNVESNNNIIPPGMIEDLNELFNTVVNVVILTIGNLSYKQIGNRFEIHK